MLESKCEFVSTPKMLNVNPDIHLGRFFNITFLRTTAFPPALLYAWSSILIIQKWKWFFAAVASKALSVSLLQLVLAATAVCSRADKGYQLFSRRRVLPRLLPASCSRSYWILWNRFLHHLRLLFLLLLPFLLNSFLLLLNPLFLHRLLLHLLWGCWRVSLLCCCCGWEDKRTRVEWEVRGNGFGGGGGGRVREGKEGRRVEGVKEVWWREVLNCPAGTAAAGAGLAGRTNVCIAYAM